MSNINKAITIADKVFTFCWVVSGLLLVLTQNDLGLLVSAYLAFNSLFLYEIGLRKSL